MLGLLGPNGAGKTTFLNLLLTLLIPDEGEIKIFNKNPFIEKEVLQRLNFVPAEKPRSSLSVRDFLIFYAKLYNVSVERVDNLLKKLGLKELEKSSCWMLSTGEISKVCLAKALLNEPGILILDEPMSGLDPKVRSEVRILLKKLNQVGTTILFTSHNVLEVERLANRIAFIKNGKILDIREKEEIIKKFESVENYWLKLGK